MDYLQKPAVNIFPKFYCTILFGILDIFIVIAIHLLECKQFAIILLITLQKVFRSGREIGEGSWYNNGRYSYLPRKGGLTEVDPNKHIHLIYGRRYVTTIVAAVSKADLGSC